MSSNERSLVRCGLALLAPVLLFGLVMSAQNPAFSVVEATIPQMQAAMATGNVTSREIVQQYLARMASYEDRLNAVLAVNPRALEEADARDRERAQGKVRGPLHGIPIAIKDNIQTTDMPTTGGALAFDGFVPPYEATVTRNLREAGAIIIAKTNMTELANWVAADMPGNYNAIAGYGLNPYDPRRDPRDGADGRPALSPGGSSSGAGTSANFWAANVGTETSGSILTPASLTMLAAIKPTVGRISRYGVIPLAADQDTAGPMARTVTDAAILLGVLKGVAADPKDPITTTCARVPGGDYTRFLNAGGLAGARIGSPRAFFYEKITLPGARELRGGLDDDEARLMAEAIAALRKQGAVVVDPVEIPSVVSSDTKSNVLFWGPCSGPGNARGTDGGCSVVFKYGMKRDFNAWLASLGPSAPVRTLAELRSWNAAHQKSGAIKYGQAQLIFRTEMDLRPTARVTKPIASARLAPQPGGGIDAVIGAHKLDAGVSDPRAPSSLRRLDIPTVIVPFGFVPNVQGLALPRFELAVALRRQFHRLVVQRGPADRNWHSFEQATKRRGAAAVVSVTLREGTANMGRALTVNVEQVGPTTGKARPLAQPPDRIGLSGEGGDDRGPPAASSCCCLLAASSVRCWQRSRHAPQMSCMDARVVVTDRLAACRSGSRPSTCE